jgi:hypothetical protein
MGRGSCRSGECVSTGLAGNGEVDRQGDEVNLEAHLVTEVLD